MNFFMAAAIAAVAAIACSEKSDSGAVLEKWPWEDQTQEPVTPEVKDPNQAYVDAGWMNVGEQFGALPAHINVYKAPTELEGKAVVAYIAVADMARADWDVWSVKADNTYKTEDSYRTPSEVYAEGEWPIVINGGYFFYEGANYTSSLAVSEGEVFAYNINYASEDWVTVYSPTRAAFLQKTDGTFDACWTFWNNMDHFTYQIPSDNSYDEAPKQVPSANYPEKSVKFAAETAIGGGPVLINKGKFANTWSEEMFDVGGVNPTYDNPRTAIGATSDKKLIFFVCEGRNMTEGVSGLTTEDLANILLDLGCVEAINLDGGGSSCMLVNGKETIKVSDGTQRYVASTVMMK